MIASYQILNDSKFLLTDTWENNSSFWYENLRKIATLFENKLTW